MWLGHTDSWEETPKIWNLRLPFVWLDMVLGQPDWLFAFAWIVEEKVRFVRNLSPQYWTMSTSIWTGFAIQLLSSTDIRNMPTVCNAKFENVFNRVAFASSIQDVVSSNWSILFAKFSLVILQTLPETTKTDVYVLPNSIGTYEGSTAIQWSTE